MIFVQTINDQMNHNFYSMKKNIFLLYLLAFTSIISAQNKLKVSFEPHKDFPWTVLYELKDVKQNYIDNKQMSKDSTFTYNMDKLKPGVYLLMYDMDANHYIYFLYNNENVSLRVTPRLSNKVEILQSKENKVYLPYAGKQSLLVHRLNELENALSEGNFNDEKKVKFNKLKQELNKLQTEYTAKSDSLLAHKYIVNMKEYYPDINLPKDEYFADKMAHYFDGLNFDDPDLQRSNILINKINTYVFRINPPKQPKTQHLEYLKRIENVLSKIKSEKYRNNVIFSLTASFVDTDGRVSKALINDYIKKMSPEYQKQINVEGILAQVGISIGEKAPEFSFEDLKGNKYTLSKIVPAKPYTLLIFWSATCPHCLHAMPKISKMMKDVDNFNVVAIGLESENYPWSSEHQYYPDFYHGIKLKKWDNPIVKLYGINATPSFFILNDKGEVIAKPYEVKNIKEFLDGLKK